MERLLGFRVVPLQHKYPSLEEILWVLATKYNIYFSVFFREVGDSNVVERFDLSQLKPDVILGTLDGVPHMCLPHDLEVSRMTIDGILIRTIRQSGGDRVCQGSPPMV
jgi:hypothetical protein